MLMAQDGRRAGTVSGGCLEAEVAQARLVAHRRWSRRRALSPPSTTMATALRLRLRRPVFHLCWSESNGRPSAQLRSRPPSTRRMPIAIATVLEGTQIGTAAIDRAGSRRTTTATPILDEPLPTRREHSTAVVSQSFRSSRPSCIDEHVERASWADYRASAARACGSLARATMPATGSLARELGWFVAVADGRSHLATRERFPAATATSALDIAATARAAARALFDLRPTDAAVVMTHSFEQDSRILASLLTLEVPPAYIGVLGPQRRTRELLAETARLLNLPALSTADRALAGATARAHRPRPRRGHTRRIALSILAEIQQTLTAPRASRCAWCAQVRAAARLLSLAALSL